VALKLAQSTFKPQKNLQKLCETAPKHAVSGFKGPIVTLWQQWGAKFPFTSKLTQGHACFRPG
jgi:hypothetical protein